MEFTMPSCSLIRRLLISTIGLIIAATAVYAETDLSSTDGTFAAFQDPSAEYRSAPLWVWHGRVTEAQIDEQLRGFKEQGIGGVFVHARGGLITPYLSDEWLDRFEYAVKVGKSLGMKIWIYDENNYPSGFAGGHVKDALPDAAITTLGMTRAESVPNPLPPKTLLVLKREGDGFIDITDSAAEHTGACEYRVFTTRQQEGPMGYVDILRRDVTDTFLEVTLDAYKQRFGEEFGKTVPGSFQDEAILFQMAMELSFTPALFDTFQAKWGYDLITNLPSLYEEVGDWRRVRHNYQSVILDLEIENWARPYYEYCERNNLKFTGHYWEHEWPYPRFNPDNMAMAAWAHMPGVDILENDWEYDTHAQFGNVRAIKEIRSAANQTGHARTLSETYGAAGWDLNFIEQKMIGDWEYALGVNFLNHHLSFMTLMGIRKRDHPLSFSYHEAWFNEYRVLGDYFGRLSVAMTAGDQNNRIIVLEPTTSAWMYQATNASPHRFNDEHPILNVMGEGFQTFLHDLERHQVEYDLGSENILHDRGSVEGNALKVGECRYDLVVLPAGMENIDSSTLDLLKRYLDAGGTVLAWEIPKFVDGVANGEPGTLAKRHPSGWLLPDDGIGSIGRIIPPAIEFDFDGLLAQRFYHHRRELDDCQLVFLANSNDRKPGKGRVPKEAKGRFLIPGGSVERWDALTGETSPYPFTREGDRLSVDFDLQPTDSVLLCVRPERASEFSAPEFAKTALTPRGQLAITRETPNVITLDYCDLILDGKAERDLFVYNAQQKAYKHNGLGRNPWGGLQYKTQTLDRDNFPADSGFDAEFSFTMEPGVNCSGMKAVVERPHLYTVILNGTELSPNDGEWWLDKAFGVFDIGAAVKDGENVLTLRSAPFTIHTELEAVYLLGDFKLEPRNKGFTLVPDDTLVLGSWKAQGMPFYANVVKYSHEYAVSSTGTADRRYLVRLADWEGAVTEVMVNGKRAGNIAFLPFELDVTEYVTPGTNRIDILVYGTLRNTLGPHHGSPPEGRARSWVYTVGAENGCPPGLKYLGRDYGLNEDFQFVAVDQAR
jgi:hypothetical protein